MARPVARGLRQVAIVAILRGLIVVGSPNLHQHTFLVTPLGTDLNPSVTMTGDKINPSKVDSTLVDVKYEDIPEESRKQFEAQLKKEQEEATKRLLA